ncbi:MAG: hypothetical protein ABL974_23865 [Prosthecobacter sp.]
MNIPTGLLDRLLAPFSDSLDEKAARALIELRADDETQAYIEDLAERSREGLLSAEEQRQYLSYANAISVISLLQAKARRHLRQISQAR